MHYKVFSDHWDLHAIVEYYQLHSDDISAQCLRLVSLVLWKFWCSVVSTGIAGSRCQQGEAYYEICSVHGQGTSFDCSHLRG
ncbi:hypothetical protein A2U01_0069315, partial [Trifolium medium]|nr:hypothetical protein [Trifolium medium]